MAVLEITLTPDYVDSWGVWEGVREMVQNAKDGEVEHGAKMSVHMTDSGTLVIENAGVTIPRESLLIGFSSKRNNEDTMGQFGEGLKLGTLALVRGGYAVRIRNGDEVWRPEIRRSEKFNSDVLAFRIHKARGKGIDGLRVEIEGIGKDSWDKLSRMFTFLHKPKKKVETLSGDLLLDEEFRGMVFVKGIFVERDPKFRYGYDLKRALIDRDRRMVSRVDLRWETARIWNEAVAKSPKLIERALNLLQVGAEEVENWGWLSNMRSDTVDAVADGFKKEHGENAVPVKSLAHSKEVEYLGRRGVVVPESFANVLEKKFGNFDKMKKDLLSELITYYGWSELTDKERCNLEVAIAMIAEVDGRINLDHFDVVKFQDKYTLGQYKDGRCLISKGELKDLRRTLRVVAHEWCHEHGVDGAFEFTDAVESMLAKVAVVWFERMNEMTREV